MNAHSDCGSPLGTNPAVEPGGPAPAVPQRLLTFMEEKRTAHQQVREMFIEEIESRGIYVVRGLPDGSLVLNLDRGELVVDLEQLASTTTDPFDIRREVDSLLRPLPGIPNWPKAAEGIRFSAEPADSEFGDALYEEITPGLARVLVHADPPEKRICWLTKVHLSRWGVERKELESLARKNLDATLDMATVKESDGLTHLAAPAVSIASLLLAPNIARFCASHFGGDVLALVPSRSLVLLLAMPDDEALRRAAPIALKHFENSEYPITTEILRIGPSGLQVHGDCSELS